MFRELFEGDTGTGDTIDHKYSKNTLKELNLLLKHHKEDLKEYEREGTKEEINHVKHDIKEIEDAILKKS